MYSWKKVFFFRMKGVGLFVSRENSVVEKKLGYNKEGRFFFGIGGKERRLE